MWRQDERQVSTPVCDDLFEILEIPDAADERARVDRASAITREIRLRGLTPEDAAELLRISQAEVRSIMNVRIDDFSPERLDQMLTTLRASAA